MRKVSGIGELGGYQQRASQRAQSRGPGGGFARQMSVSVQNRRGTGAIGPRDSR